VDYTGDGTRMAKLKAGLIRSGWRLIEKLGAGGNADVWLCEPAGGGDEAAVKFLRRLDRYERFRREVEFHRGRAPHVGVLPLLDAHLPDEPGTDDDPWFSMPPALPIDKALRSRPLAEVVAAVAAVASTLAELAEEDVHHRDVKPGNLYRYEDAWVIGDFGLIYLPDAASLSASDEVIGPFGYIPSELFIDPDGADGERVDVYELAKTLWVLAADARWPPQGPQHPPDDGTGIARYRFHQLAGDFDRLIQIGTRPQAQRPTMREFEAELNAWLELESTQPAESDVNEVLARLREQSQPYVDETTQRARLGEAFEMSWREMAEILEPLVSRLIVALPHINPNQRHSGVQDVLRTSFDPTGDAYEMYVRDSWAAMASFRNEHTFVSGVCFEVTNDGVLVVTGGHFIDMGVYDQFPEWRTTTERATIGTVAGTAALRRIAEQLDSLLPDALEALSCELAANRGDQRSS
jgi:serine/threonine protein kinase